ncbi:MAG: response regulator [Planctomycetia bacterium]
MASLPSALLVMPDGAQRRALAAALRDLRLEVRLAGEPYGAALALGEVAPRVVLLDLRVVRRRDRAFVQALKQRHPQCRVLLLLAEGTRERALALLRAGADAYLLAPCDADELGAVLRGWLQEGTGGAPPRGAMQLSDEVAHAINNPLQVLSLWAESQPAGSAEGLEEAVLEPIARMREVVQLLAAFGGLAAPQRTRVDLGALLEAALAGAAGRGRIVRAGRAPASVAEAAADTRQVAAALEAVLACLAGLGAPGPVRVRARLLPALEAGDAHRLQLLAEGLALEPQVLEALPGLVLASHPQTRQPHAGLALPAAVAQAHGGRLRLARHRRGLVVTLAFPA